MGDFTLLICLLLVANVGATTICMMMAQAKGRNPIPFFAVGMYLGLLGIIITALVPTGEKE
ncbi:hypothetical protein [Adlercreutzia caecimuris]|uniref:hypothetical protein n=1 Tax=Adlercreutzia caecimuris TaxID=671266 RepID=UPI00136493AF|nr:hypothetical protein [Adlercreutzia caecimuris]NBJ65723.1 hypothetical protein [Adlercreutzia caecimuris]